MAYVEPTPADLQARYPAFAGVADATIQIHLDDTASAVDQSWPEVDYIPAKVAKAAHEMALVGIGAQDEVAAYAQLGVARLRSGNLDVTLSESAVSRSSGGGLDATVYGQAYKRILRRVKGGPRLAGGPARVDGWGPTAQLNDGGILPWAS